MPLTTLSSREFNQDVGKAKRAAESGPVVITDRGQPAYVLMKHEAYRELLGKRPSLLDRLKHEESKDIDFEPEKMRDGWLRPVDLG
jgi:PHD/YefM family antitoxin component YafN of YafNO toxin-antitoxin module